MFLDASATAAVIDRVIHHATIFKTDGPSYRLKQAKEGRSKRKEGSLTRARRRGLPYGTGTYCQVSPRRSPPNSTVLPRAPS